MTFVNASSLNHFSPFMIPDENIAVVSHSSRAERRRKAHAERKAQKPGPNYADRDPLPKAVRKHSKRQNRSENGFGIFTSNWQRHRKLMKMKARRLRKES